MYKAKATFCVPGHKKFKEGEVYDIIPKVASDLEKRGLVEEVKSKSDERRKVIQKDSKKDNKAKDEKSQALKK